MGDNLPPLPEPAHRGTDVSGWYSDAFTAAQLVAFAEEAVKQEREAAAKAIEVMRDDHCAATKKSDNKNDWCEPDDQCCEFVVAWNEAAAAIRGRSSQVEQGKL